MTDKLISESERTKVKKNSWWPFAAAFMIPLVVIVVGLRISERIAEREGERPQPVAENVYVTVHVADKTGAAVAGREVTFLHEMREIETGATASIPHVSRTDAAGIATTTLPKTGNITISVAGSEEQNYIEVLENRTSREFEFRMKVGQ